MKRDPKHFRNPLKRIPIKDEVVFGFVNFLIKIGEIEKVLLDLVELSIHVTLVIQVFLSNREKEKN